MLFISTLPNSSQIHSYSTIPHPSLISLLFYNPESSLCCTYTHGCGVIHWSTVYIPGPQPLKKTDASSSSRHHLPTAPPLGTGAHEPLPVCPGCRLARTCAYLMQTSTGAVSSHMQHSCRVQVTDSFRPPWPQALQSFPDTSSLSFAEGMTQVPHVQWNRHSISALCLVV